MLQLGYKNPAARESEELAGRCGTRGPLHFAGHRAEREGKGSRDQRVSVMTSHAYGSKTCNCNNGQEEMSTGSGIGTTQEATV